MVRLKYSWRNTVVLYGAVRMYNNRQKVVCSMEQNWRSKKFCNTFLTLSCCNCYTSQKCSNVPKIFRFFVPHKKRVGGLEDVPKKSRASIRAVEQLEHYYLFIYLFINIYIYQHFTETRNQKNCSKPPDGTLWNIGTPVPLAKTDNRHFPTGLILKA